MHSFTITWLCLSLGWISSQAHSIAEPLISSIEVSTVATAPDDGTYWMQARPAIIPLPSPHEASAGPAAVITLQKTERVGTHMYHGLEAMWSADLGTNWTAPQPLPSVDRIVVTNGILEAPVDMTPQFHRKTGKLLVTGATFFQDPLRHRDVPRGGSATAYAVYDPQTKTWRQWQKLQMPPGGKFQFSRAGCTQRVDLPDGDILLPIYYRPQNTDTTFAIVLRCSFDGSELRYQEHGSELTVVNDDPRKRKGVHEPSLTVFHGRYFLTMRNDERGYVTTSEDGLHYGPPQRWKSDDGTELGSYNTQQHWVTHSDRLFLAYTRRGAANDDVFRNRAPLFLAEVDPEKLVVRRATEQILLPNLGKAFGNFGVCNVSPQETWIVDCLVDAEPETSNVFLARVHWSQPNRLVSD